MNPTVEEMNAAIFNSPYAGERALSFVHKHQPGGLLYDVSWEWLISSWKEINKKGSLSQPTYMEFHLAVDDNDIESAHKIIYEFIKDTPKPPRVDVGGEN